MTESRKPFRLWPWILAGVALTVILAVLAAGGRGKKPGEGKKPVVSGYAGSIKANNSMNSSSSHTSTDDSLFFTKRIGVLNRTDHKIPSEVAQGLAEVLRNQAYVKTVDVFQGDKRPVDGQRLYDLYISVEMPEFSSKGLLLTGREVEAKLKLTIGNNFWDSRHGHHDHLSPPLINLHMESILYHKSVARGVEMPGNPYRQVVANISTQVCESVTESLGELSAKFGVLDSMPEGLVPGFRPTPPLPLPQSEVLNQVVSGYGFMLNNYTVWTMEAVKTRKVLTEMLQALKLDGWHAGSPRFDEEQSQYHFRATKGNLVLEAFEARGYGPRKEGECIRLVFRYSDRMGKSQLSEVLERIVQAEPVPLATWQAFSRLMSREQNERILEKIEGRNDLPLSAEVRLVRHLNRTGRKEEAQKRLHKAAFLARLVGSVDDDQLEKLGKEITGSEDWQSPEPTVEDLVRFGVRKAVPGELFELELGLGEPALFFAKTNERIGIMSVEIVRSKVPEGIFTIRTAEFTIPERGKSSSSSTPHTTSRPWKASTGNHMGDIYWHISVEEIEGERFLLKLENNAS